MSFWKRKDINPSTENEVANSPRDHVPDPLVFKGLDSTPNTSSAIPSERNSAPPLPTEDLLLQRYGKVRSALGSGTVIQGKLSFDTSVRIDGKLSGNVFCSRVLIIGPSGEIDAEIEAATLVVMGKVKGKVKATERVELVSGGCLNGTLETPIFTMEEGCLFDGSCKMPPLQEQPEAGLAFQNGDRRGLQEEKVGDSAKIPAPLATKSPLTQGNTGSVASMEEASLH